mmetsp:Transcript_137538/g.348552  ORF Transcript_137538/g.348552 Transcript_137538/m.348552 type:complete len:89 (-) Transcript_137538:78-344(-)
MSQESLSAPWVAVAPAGNAPHSSDAENYKQCDQGDQSLSGWVYRLQPHSDKPSIVLAMLLWLEDIVVLALAQEFFPGGALLPSLEDKP